MSYTPNFTDRRVANRCKQALFFVIAKLRSNEPEEVSDQILMCYFGQGQLQSSKYLRNLLIICVDHYFNSDTGTNKKYIINWTGVIFLTKTLSGTTTQSWEQWLAVHTTTASTDLLALSEENGKALCIPHAGITTELSPLAKLQANIDKYADKINNTTRILTEQQAYNRTFTSVFEEEFDLVDQQSVINEYEEQIQHQLLTGERDYEEKSDRDFTIEHNIPGIIRMKIYPKYGYKYDYDIDCCQPSIISQYAQMNGLTAPLKTIVHYITNKHLVRAQLSEELNVPVKDVKQIINALFNGAPIQFPHGDIEPAIFKLVGKNYNKLGRLQSNPFIVQLQEEIKLCWDAIKPTIEREYKIVGGKSRLLPITPKIKSRIYREQETIINRVMRKYIHKHPGYFALSIHDGFLSNNEINQQELIDVVLEQTGYVIRLSVDFYL